MLLLLSCVVVHLPEADDVLLAVAQTQDPSASVESLASGRALVLDRCGSCHRVPSPNDTKDREWAETFLQMQEEAELSLNEAALIEAYLKAGAALPPPDPSTK